MSISFSSNEAILELKGIYNIASAIPKWSGLRVAVNKILSIKILNDFGIDYAKRPSGRSCHFGFTLGYMDVQ